MPDNEILLKAYRLMIATQCMAKLYDENRALCKYVHSTSLGHQAIQLATAFQLKPQDYVSPYYRDESLLLGLGFTPGQLMRQLLAKADDPFSEGRSYYSHPSSVDADKPKIIHQSSATGMQAIPSTGIAQGLKYLETLREKGDLPSDNSNLEERGIVVCSFGDASFTEGEVSEALQVAVLKKLPIIYLVQDNRWGISVTSEEARVMDAVTYASGFTGIKAKRIDGTKFIRCYDVMEKVVADVRNGNGPWLVQADVPLLGHHTSGVRKEFYRSESDLALHGVHDPIPKLKVLLLENGISESEIAAIEQGVAASVKTSFESAVNAPDPDPCTVSDFVFAPTKVLEEYGERMPAGNEKLTMVDAALIAIREIMKDYPEALLYGQDVGLRLGGVFREAATLSEQFGDHRVFNTAIQEAYIIGSTAGMSATGAKPIVEVQFADYMWPALNQLVSEISKSCYLTAGKYPVQTLIRVPVGAYNGGGPYHSGSIETTLLSIKGIKVVYPSNAADMKGLMKAAFLDPNPVIMLEHKGLYWSKVASTDEAKCIEPSRDYIIPLGKGRIVLEADEQSIKHGESCCIITYGMGVYWAKAAAINFKGKVEIIDLRTLFPLDEALVYETVKRHGKCLVLTEEQQNNSFAEALAGRIAQNCFHELDAPVAVLGSLNLPAVPINLVLEKAMLPNADKVRAVIEKLLKE
jgi:2-oxoisovalerate dehydrogenase E1 component